MFGWGHPNALAHVGLGVEIGRMNDCPQHQDRPNVTIRMASASDAIVLARLRYSLRSSLDRPQESEETFVERCRLWMQERLQHPGPWKCWIAEQERIVVGNLWAQLIEKIPNPASEPERHLYFTNFFVREDCRGKGVGSRLFSAALKWSRKNSIHAAILWPTERSRNFYLRHGFLVSADLMELRIDDGTNESAEAERQACNGREEEP